MSYESSSSSGRHAWGNGSLHEAVFESGNGFTFLLTGDGRIVDAADHALAFADATRGEVVTTEFWNTPWFRADETHRQQLKEDIQRVIGGETVQREYRIQGTDGAAVVAMSIRPVPTGGAEPNRLFVTGVEITELHRRLEALDAQNRALEEFVRVAAHDVRDLLAVATGTLQLATTDVGRGERVEVARERLETVEATLHRIGKLIDNLSRLAREGKLVGERSEHELAAIATEAWQHVDTREASLSIESSTQIRADRTRLMEVFENCYRNAVEHAGPAVTVRVGTTDDGFYIEDDGPGLPERGETLFDVGVSTADGMGLGLSIVETIVTAHGWTLSATDSADGGARFEIRMDGEQ